MPEDHPRVVLFDIMLLENPKTRITMLTLDIICNNENIEQGEKEALPRILHEFQWMKITQACFTFTKIPASTLQMSFGKSQYEIPATSLPCFPGSRPRPELEIPNLVCLKKCLTQFFFQI